MQYDDALRRAIEESEKETFELAALEQRCIAEPQNAVAHFALAEVLALRGRFAEAAKAYHAALTCNPNYIEALVGLGLVELQRGEIVSAVEALSKAAALSPQSAEIHFYLGNALDDAGKNEEAIKAFETALDLKPDYEEVHLALGFLYYRIGNQKGVREQYRVLQALQSPLAEQLARLL
ncbi:MAG: tetratricopeptide repeat protein [Chloroherpetonaceae bacterium]|nr:tetratricopeptide repeat protein [Chloroherpetonaceae bacterium]MCS7212496.1 tetratricopeptide repeat protein [Chloroherpetonaceae bacterium]MDW8020180.1 tetratricopeptide repeat protein [Chloroherpetonaceae bacterium]MDW8465179.1 tetratricopeptide repeat protein [Chloroherpetonaceae bacterium]